MKLLAGGLTLLTVVIATGTNSIAKTQGNSFYGTVEQVWDDGFRLKTDESSLIVDSWDLCKDSTFRHLSSGDKVTVEGEFEGEEFDAFSITKVDDDVKVCS